MPFLRDVRPADWKSLNDLHRWAWFPERSQDGWNWVHRFGQGRPGWVLEDDEGVCGYLGNIRQNYTLLDARLVGATGYSLIVLPRARGGSRLLLDAFRSQSGVFSTTILNSNALAAPIYSRGGFTAFPAGWANAKIIWPLAPLTIVSERIARSLYRKRRPSRELFCGLTNSPPASRAAQARALDPWRDAAALDLFWAELSSAGSLIADRSARALQDRFSDPDRQEPPLLFGWKEDDCLSAIAFGQLGKMTECEAPILDIIDVAWLEPHGSAAATALLIQLKDHGRRAGASRMRLSLVNNDTMAVARKVPGAILRRRHTQGHLRLVADEGLVPLWNPTPYDGDYSFCLRPPPADPDDPRRGMSPTPTAPLPRGEPPALHPAGRPAGDHPSAASNGSSAAPQPTHARTPFP